MAYVYLIEHEGFTKIGITGDLVNRLRGYQTAAPNRDFSYAHTWEVPTIEEARRIESAVMADADEAWWPRKNEWIKMPASLMASVVEDCLS